MYIFTGNGITNLDEITKLDEKSFISFFYSEIISGEAAFGKCIK